MPTSPFYFLRHGQTDWNLQHKLMGNQDVELNEAGREQAINAAYAFNGVEISKIFSSSLKRAIETGKIIAQVHDIELETLVGLKERSFGSFEGKENNNVSFLSDANIAIDGEKYLDFEKRVIEAIRKILLSPYKYPVIVAHSGVFKILAHLLARKQDVPCPNCEVFFFTPPALSDKWEINRI